MTTLASILRAQLATGRPLRVTRALLEALVEPPADPLPWLMESRRFLDAVDFRAEGESPSDAVKRLRRERDEERARANEWLAKKHDAERERDEARRERDEAREEVSALLSASTIVRERDEARRELAEAQQSLRERVAEREALCERVSVLEEQDARLEAALRGALETAIGRASPETMAREIREAEERGARWALEEWCRRGLEGRGREEAERICAEARKRGDDE